jgi:lipoyl(octanoyl) transferase
VRPAHRTSALPAADPSPRELRQQAGALSCSPAVGTTWRLVGSGSADGPTNMAVDEALLLSFDPTVSLPILRFYGWEPSALSLGRFQDAAAVLDLERCHAAGLPLVRRISGGGVIYHGDELTYSIVCAPRHLPPATSIKESFRHLTGFLLLFYKKLGLHPSYAMESSPGGHLGERTPFCFAGQESYDILVQGKKIGGNAQRRLKEVIFQHGSIPLLNRAEEGGSFMTETPAGIREQTFSLAQAGIGGDVALLNSLLADSFREALGVDLRKEGLTVGEEIKSGELRGKYRNDGWNLRGVWP